MRSFLVALATAATLVAAQLRIETPSNLIVCQPAMLTWAGGKSPYYISVIPGGDPSGAALKDFGESSDQKLTWTVDLPAGQSVSLRISDSTGELNYSKEVTILEGTNTNCMNGTSASSGASGAASGAASSAAGAASSASSGTASAASSASGAASSATGAAGNAASSVSSRVAGSTGSAGSSVTSATNAAGNAAASATSTGAAPLGAKVQYAGVLGAVAAVFGVALF